MNNPRAARLHGIAACVFDAYGTLFDVGSVARAAADDLGDRGPHLSDLWRTKQLQYTWLRGLAGQHADFWQVTGDALDFALQSLNFHDERLRERLMDQYLRIGVFSEVPAMLEQLKDMGMKLAILSNGTPRMLASALDHCGLSGVFDAVLSVEDVGVYKPDPRVYQMAPDWLHVQARELCFVSANGWDACSAKAFGYRVIWCNRRDEIRERLPAPPDGEIRDLAALASWVSRG